MTQMSDQLRRLAALETRPRLTPRALEELYRLPDQALITPAEASAVARITESGLAVRRTKGEWPPYLKFGRLVRYRLGDVITAPNDRVVR
jgi:hypothetical protein